MECQGCGRYSEPDRATGYDADDLCPRCRDHEEAEQLEALDPVAMADRNIRMALMDFIEAVDLCETVNQAKDLRDLLHRHEQHLALLVDRCQAKMRALSCV